MATSVKRGSRIQQTRSYLSQPEQAAPLKDFSPYFLAWFLTAPNFCDISVKSKKITIF